MFTALISSLALGQSLLVAHLLSRRVVHSNVYLPLAIFFAANAIAQLCFILREPCVFGADIIFIPGLTLFKLIVELTLPPLLWIYVRELTSTHSLGWRKSDIWHFVFPLVPSVILAIISYLFTTNTEIGGNPETSLIGELNGVLNIAALVQFCVYVIFVMRRLKSYRRRLMDFFASTTNMELRWFRTALLLILFGIALEVCAEILYAIYAIQNPFVPWNSLVRLALVWFFAAWGLRQTPDLSIEIAKASEQGDKPNSRHAENKKYEKSALSKDQLEGVAAKIRKAAEQERIYKDPTLSLRSLSEQIQVLPNYASQALNMEINETFFDYINRLRVLDAMERLVTSDDTVLAISSEVGFNSRSSFYIAFKKVTGETPISYRKIHSEA